jgi:hypothetical protein
MHPDDLERLAELVADRIAERLTAPASAPQELLDVKALAKALGVSPTWVYDHAGELGGIKLGRGPKARWRFDIAVARDRMRTDPEASHARRQRARRHVAQTSKGVPLLPIGGRSG